MHAQAKSHPEASMRVCVRTPEHPYPDRKHAQLPAPQIAGPPPRPNGPHACSFVRSPAHACLNGYLIHVRMFSSTSASTLNHMSRSFSSVLASQCKCVQSPKHLQSNLQKSCKHFIRATGRPCLDSTNVHVRVYPVTRLCLRIRSSAHPYARQFIFYHVREYPITNVCLEMLPTQVHNISSSS